MGCAAIEGCLNVITFQKAPYEAGGECVPAPDTVDHIDFLK